MQYKYKAFISYSHADEKWARWLHNTLETYRTPRRLTGRATPSGGKVPGRLSPIFRDREDLASSADLSARIHDALNGSENMVVICSPDAARSQWVCKEIETYKKLGRSDRIFCLVVDGDPSARRTEADCFPPIIRQNYDSKGKLLEGEAEPIAADLRASGDGKTLARVKILAGLLEVDLDQLRQREQQRKQRRLLALVMTSLLVAALTSALAIDATLARKESEQRQKQAESLLEFLVGDLRESLAQLGRLDLLESVSEKANDYFAAVNIDSLSDNELLHQAKVITQFGEIRLEQFQYEDALGFFLDAYRRSSLLQSNNPGDGDRLFSRGQAEFWIGYVYWMRGNSREAENWLRRYLATSTELTELDPGNIDWRKEEAYGQHNLGALNLEFNRLDIAERHFSNALGIYDEIQTISDSDEVRSQAADAISYLGDIAQMKGALRSAVDFYLRSVREQRLLGEANAGNMQSREDLAGALRVLMDAHAWAGDIESAQEVLAESLSITDELVATDEENINWRHMQLEAKIMGAYLYFTRGKFTEADVIIDQILPELEKLNQMENIDRSVNSSLADSRRLKAVISLSKSDYQSADEILEQAHVSLQALVDSGWSGEIPRGRLANIYLLQGELRLKLAALEEAAASLQRAAQAMEAPVRTQASHHLLDPWARYLILADRQAEAQEVIRALSSRGYRPLVPWPQH